MASKNCQNLDIKRTFSGSIDYEFYHHQAKKLRSETVWKLTGKAFLSKISSCIKVFRLRKASDLLARYHLGRPHQC